MKRAALIWVLCVGCGSRMQREPTTPGWATEEEDASADAETTGDVPMRAEDVPPRVRLAAASALQGAEKISFVHTSSGQYEATATIDGEEQDVTISPSGSVIEMEDVDDIDLTDDDDAPATAAAPTDRDDGDDGNSGNDDDDDEQDAVD